MEGKTNFSRRLKQFDGLIWLTLTPSNLRQTYATGYESILATHFKAHGNFSSCPVMYATTTILTVMLSISSPDIGFIACLLVFFCSQWSVSATLFFKSRFKTVIIYWKLIQPSTRLTPRPPSLTGRLACSHWMSGRFELVIPWMQFRKRESKVSKAAWETEGAQRRRCKTLIWMLWKTILIRSAHLGIQCHAAYLLLWSIQHSNHSTICPTQSRETKVHPKGGHHRHQLV